MKSARAQNFWRLLVIGAVVFAATQSRGGITDNIYNLRGTPSNNIYLVNIAAGNDSVVYTNYPGGSAATLAMRPSDGMLFYVINAANGVLYRWNPATPATAPVPIGTGIGAGVPAGLRMTFSQNGTLYFMTGTNLYTIDTATGLASAPVSLTGSGAGGDMAFSPDGTFYIIDNTTLYTAPVGGGAATTVGAVTGVTGSIIGLGFDPNGRMIICASDAANSRYYSVDTTTLVATVIGPASGAATTGDLASASAQRISGKVFEDVNYGGGAGRSLASSAGVPRANARVELYDSAGNFVVATTTDATGSFNLLAGTAGQTYTLRVVNSTVTSSRTGYVAGMLPVQTFRTDASGGTPVAVTDFVGGQNPAVADAAAGSAGTVMNPATGVFTSGITGQAQSFTALALGTTVGGAIANVDFGFNFDAVVNINDTGQGSSRQMITNANGLSNTGLAQSGKTAGIENVIFMISNGTSGFGLRNTNNYFVGGVATVAPASALPTASDPIVIDGTAQPGFSTTPVIQLNGAGAGAGVNGLAISAGGSTVRGLVINRFNGSGISLSTSGSNTITGNFIGTNAAGTGASANAQNGIDIVSGNTNTIGGTTASAANVLSGNTGSGLNLRAGISGTTVQGNFIGTDSTGSAAIANGTGITLTTANNNTIGGAAAGARNVIASNTGKGIAVVSGTGNTISRNSIYSNGGIGIDLGNDGVTVNDSGDVDAGANGLFNFSVVSAASIGGGNLVLTGFARPGSTIEVFVATPDASGFGQGRTYVTTLVEGSAADLDATTGTYTNPVNGLNQGTDTTNKFRFSIPTPGGVSIGTVLTTTATDASANTSEFSGNVTVATLTISGKVFEDVNYGGGAGRDLTTSAGVVRQSTTVELYDNAGAYVSNTTTDAAGLYTFSGLAAANYTVRVVNNSVTSSRTGYVPGLLPVQTFRTNGLTGTVGTPDPNRVGGENPAVAGAGPGGPGTVMDPTTGVFTAGITGQAQSIITVTVGAASITGIDFGFNFDTIVNVNDASQGSLRQFITNANALDNAGLAQVGQTAGKEVTIFMMSDGAVHPGLRAGLTSQLTGGVAVIIPTTLFPAITGPDTVIDGTTQTTDVGNTNAGTLGVGGAVGIDNLALSTVNRPEVQLNDSGIHLARGLDAQANNITIRGIAIYGFGNNRATGTGEANIRVGGFSGALIEQNILGTSATSFTDPGAAARTLGDNITLVGPISPIVRNNLLGYASYMGVLSVTSSTGATIQANEIRGNGIGHGNQDGVSFEGNSNTGTVTGNLITGDEGCGVDMPSTTGSNTIVNNTITGNGLGTDAVVETPGIRVYSTGNVVDRNIISANVGAGVMVNFGASGNKITRNSIFGNGPTTNQIGIDLLIPSDLPKVGTAPFVTINDSGDADTGANGLLNFPVVTTATITGGNLILTGFARPGSVIEWFIATPDPSGFGEGTTYLTTLTEGSGADTDATTGTYTNPVNGLNQGTDTTNKFRFSIPVPGGVTTGTILTATATDASNNTSEFSGNVTVTTLAISGKVFEDVNYGGGAGRDLTTSAGVVRQNATVELYDNAGAYVSNTTTDAAGLYTFSGLAAANYTVRVVNSTVTSSRAGYVPGLLSVQTFRTNGLTGTVGTPDPNRVGGENPAVAGAGPGGPGTVMDTTTGVFTAGISGQAQSITTVTVGASSITGIDFGFNFDTIVNVNDASQGSLRQFITNANALSNVGLAQSGRVAGKDNAIFMISNGTAAPGLRAVNNYFVGGIATVAPTSALPAASDPLVIDGTFQPGFVSAPIIELTGTGAGAGVTGLSISAGSSIVRGLIVNRFLSSGIALSGAGSNTIQGNYLGTNSAGTASSQNDQQGLYINGSPNNTVGGTTAAQRNIISGNRLRGILIENAGATGNIIQGNYVGLNAPGTAAIANTIGIFVSDIGNNTIGGTAAGAGNAISGNTQIGLYLVSPGASNNTVQGNIIGLNATASGAVANGTRGIDIILGASNNTIGGSAAGAPNIIASNGIHGVRITAGTNNLISRNSIYGNANIGIELGTDGVTPNDGAKNGGQPNSGMDKPVFTSAVLVGPNLTVAGYVGSAPGQAIFAGAVVEIFKSDNDPTSFGEGPTYLGFLTTDASGNFSGSISAGSLTAADTITGTATDGANNTSEFGGNAGVAMQMISGKIFEDVNYGGGAGRDLATAAGVVRQNASVELYNNTGAYVSNTTTDAAGLYTFSGLAAGDYTLRVVNGTVTSSRTGYVAGLLPVETFRTNGLTGSVGTADPNRVGGENPATVDAGAGGPGTVMNTTTGVFTAGISGQAQSITTVTASAGAITGIDFGFNFDTLVNINDSGQGSLRQLFSNANTLGGDASLAQAGLVAAKENVVFMISNGTSAPGLRAANNYFVGGIATIPPTSALPTITSPLVIDAQKQPGWTSAPIIELNGASASGNGLSITAGASTVRGFVVNRFSNAGISLTTSGGNLIAGNYVGTNATGTAALANGSGVGMDNSPNNTIGGTAAGDANVISGNTGKGVAVDNAGSTGNVIKGNRIGTNAAGTAAIASNVGIQLGGGANSTIGGTTAGAGNLISGHSSQGIFMTGGTGALVQGNLIGTDVAGTAAIPNNFGVFIAGPAGNTVGGSAAGARNVISGNFIGLDIQGTTASGNLVAGNYIGTNVTGSAALGNTGAGVILSDAPNNIIGGTAAGAGNVISGNTGNGLTLAGTSTTGTLVQGNRIGTDASGIGALGNSGVGVSVGSGGNQDNTIGGSAAGAPNTIAFNGTIGVRVWAGVRHLISRNSIFGNGALGIDLNADGVTPNDGTKNGGQPNSGMDTPVFTSAILSGGTLNVVGYVGSAPGQATFAGATVEIFKSDRDPSTFGEGPVYVASLTTDASGNFSGSFSAGSLTSADAITGTAIDGANNTSEFGGNFNLAPGVSGTVYLDVNHNSIFDSGEAGTGLTLYAKIFPTSSPGGPATQAVLVNPATGAYSFSAVTPGTYTIVLDDNNTLADVTPTIPAGWSGTEQPNQTRSNVAVPAAPLPNQNFGLIHALPLGGRVFVDTGTSGGTPNDGVLNGGETGLAGVTVKLTDATGATTYDTATTDGGGNYVLFVPQTLANGTQLKVVETNLATYVSTGASVGNTSGTYVRATDTIAFALALNVTYTNVNLGDVPDIIFTTDNAQSALPGSTIVYAHSFTAGSTGQVTFSTTRVSTPPNNSWSSILYRDVNNNGKVDAGDTVINAPIALNTGETIQILVQEVIPVNAPLNARDTITITASHAFTNANPALATSAAHTDITTVGNPTTAGLALAKSVDKATALPGETLTYTVAYTNNSSEALSNVIIFDSTPAFTTFLSAGNGPLPNDLTGVTIIKPAVGATGAIRWTFTGSLAPASNGTVTFQVKVDQ